MEQEKRDIWRWYHNVSECYYHIQITVKYRKALLNEKVIAAIVESLKGFMERYAIEISHVGFDQDHAHILARFLPKYSGDQVIKIIKSITAREVFRQVPEIKKELWGGEFWTDGYYIATISARGNRKVIERYIQNQGRPKDVSQLRLFEL
ncbi:MAG: IS200/IS605 family transposase [Candidatus Nealsonbacteria bacterium DGGOD1a]|jgi:putative transposase|nr:MAG: IS200/IS605 family transposase [Candidatus Nealsonbacteria bacterium DGGOD1a]UMX48166.1 MAG: IS200/IS605 family transposase [Candidatus Nealsonbacteria bacterium DGGOD1a]